MMKEIEEYQFGKGTIGSLFDLCCKVQTEQEAQEIIKRYKAVNSHAEENLGYIFGYGDDKTRQRLYTLFPLNHPVFGATFGREVEIISKQEGKQA